MKKRKRGRLSSTKLRFWPVSLLYRHGVIRGRDRLVGGELRCEDWLTQSSSKWESLRWACRGSVTSCHSSVASHQKWLHSISDRKVLCYSSRKREDLLLAQQPLDQWETVTAQPMKARTLPTPSSLQWILCLQRPLSSLKTQSFPFVFGGNGVLGIWDEKNFLRPPTGGWGFMESFINDVKFGVFPRGVYVLLWTKSNLVFSRTRIKAIAHNFCLMLQSSTAPASLACVPS